MAFVGSFDRQLDDKGRVALPPSFRSILGEQCYLLKGRDKCIDVIPEAEFDALAAELMTKVKNGEISLNHQRAIAATAAKVNVDKQGRITVEEKLREYAELSPDTAITLSGNLDRVEIWAPSRFERINAAGTGDLAGDDF